MRATQLSLLTMIGLLAGVLSTPAVSRSVEPAEYDTIEKRNPFGLVDPPEPVVEPVPEEPVEEEPPPNVELTGMYHDSVKDQTYALFLVQVPGELKKRSYIIPEGEGRGGVDVLNINREKSNVEIAVKGRTSTITFNERPAARVIRSRTPNIPQPPNGEATITRPQPGVVQFQSGRRQGTLNRSGRAVTAVAGGMASGTDGVVTGGLRPVPTSTAAPRGVFPGQQQQSPALSREEQSVLIEAQRAAREYQQQTSGGNLPPMPPLPPTPLTSPETLQRITVQPGQR